MEAIRAERTPRQTAPATARQTTTPPSGSFLELAAQVRAAGSGSPGVPSGAGRTWADSCSFYQAAALRTAPVSETGTAAGPDAAGGVQAPTLEELLRAKYPNLTYHVFDASSSYWRTRNDYPHYLLYQPGDKAKEVLENWQPSGENPFYGSIDGVFTAPPEIRALGSIPAGRTAVVIHPKVQQRMEEDPAYAQEIFQRIDAWFTLDRLRNEAMMPGITARSSWSVAIGEDGEIANAQSFSHGEITFSSSESGRLRPGWTWWDLRMARHAEFMQLLAEEHLEHRAEVSRLTAASGARAQLAELLNSGDLERLLGDTVIDTPTSALLDRVRGELAGGFAL